LAFAIKLGLNKVEEAADNLIRVCQDIVNNGGKAPYLSVLYMVLETGLIKTTMVFSLFP